jgi:hypothetical protein
MKRGTYIWRATAVMAFSVMFIAVASRLHAKVESTGFYGGAGCGINWYIAPDNFQQQQTVSII